MLPVHTILHPTDFSERSRHAFGLACSLARDYGARLVLLHVIPTPIIGFGEGVIPPEPEEVEAEGREQLARLQPPGANVRAERRLIEGDPVEVILRVAQEIDASLIVMGTHGRTGLGRILMGSVAEQILRRADCPVLTVKAPFTDTGSTPQPAGAERRQASLTP
jgi:nucleotide-binding universal stress UspA family protein